MFGEFWAETGTDALRLQEPSARAEDLILSIA